MLDTPRLSCKIARHLRRGCSSVVEHHVANVNVVDSISTTRSKFKTSALIIKFRGFFSSSTPRLGGRMVIQWTANPWMPVRFRPQPPNSIQSTFSLLRINLYFLTFSFSHTLAIRFRLRIFYGISNRINHIT